MADAAIESKSCRGRQRADPYFSLLSNSVANSCEQNLSLHTTSVQGGAIWKSPLYPLWQVSDTAVSLSIIFGLQSQTGIAT